MKADEPDKLAGAFQLSGPETPTTLPNQRFTLISHGITFRAGQEGGQELHHYGI